jgi:hypothetical protein
MAQKRTSRRQAPAARSAVRQLPPLDVLNPPGHEKYSEVLLRFAAPVLEEVGNGYDEVYAVISASVSAWNLSFAPPVERAAMQRAILKPIPASHRAFMKMKLDQLIERKLTLFREYQWTIVAFDVRTEGDMFHVQVMAAVGLF